MNLNISELIENLRKAEESVVESINRRMPSDSVPDNIAIPVLNRLELEQLNAEHAFSAVLRLLENLPAQAPEYLPSRHPARQQHS